VTLVGLVSACAQTPPAPTQTPTTAPTSAPPAEVIKIKAMTGFPTNTPYGAHMLWYMDRFKELAKGKAEIVNMGSNESIAITDQINALSRGVIDFLQLAPNFYENKLPIVASMRVVPRPSLADERKSGYYDFLNKAHQEKLNCVYLGRADETPMVLYTTKPIEKMADFSGLKIRSAASYIAFIQALNAVPITITDLGETYTALDRGVVDGLGLLKSGIESYRLENVIKYYITNSFTIADGSWEVNLDFWKKLPPDIQKLMSDVAIEYEGVRAQREAQNIAKSEDIMKKAGVKFVEFTGAEKEKWEQLAAKVGWEYVAKVAPESVAQMKQLLGYK
jgi:TRAP-type C4-dicarboxylate transport system substrate-binding protein